MKCIECGIVDETVKKYKLNFGIMDEKKDLFRAYVVRNLCKKCVSTNASLLKNELEFMVECDDIPTDELDLDIFIDESLM
jgi:bacterioferritin-associated ferredoxin